MVANCTLMVKTQFVREFWDWLRVRSDVSRVMIDLDLWVRCYWNVCSKFLCCQSGSSTRHRWLTSRLAPVPTSRQRTSSLIFSSELGSNFSWPALGSSSLVWLVSLVCVTEWMPVLINCWLDADLRLTEWKLSLVMRLTIIVICG